MCSRQESHRRRFGGRQLVGAAALVALALSCSSADRAADDTASSTVVPGDTPDDTASIRTDPPTTSPDHSAEPDPTEPTATDPPATDPPTTEPPTTEPPTTEPPADPFPHRLPAPDDTPMPPVDGLADVPLRLEPVLDIGNLTGMEWSVKEGAYYAITQNGEVHLVPADFSGSEVVLDLSDEVTELLPGSERGLLGIAFDPADGRMFLNYTDRVDHDTHVVSYELVGGRPDPGSRRLVLVQDQPGLGHNGGSMTFDAEGHLYIAFGDGGGSSGRDAQDPSILHGSIVRIVPDRDGEGYDVPDDNPYADDPDRLGELWVTGLRNPWQFSIDPADGDMWIGDVGENDREELNRVPAGTSGQNFGWYWLEGTLDRGRGPVPDGVEPTPPVYEYDRSVGVSIIGGVVYHGTAIPELTGAHVFADMTGPVFAYGADGAEPDGADGSGDAVRLSVNGSGVITAFAETPDRELLVLTLERGLLRLLPG